MKTFTFLCGILCVLVFQSISGYAQADVLTQHNDLKRTGWNPNETVLSPANVNSSSFGKLFVRPVDDQIYAQPLVVSGVSTAAGTRNVVYVATVNNSLYAFDADSAAVTQPYWQISLTPAGNFRVPNKNDVHPELCGFGYNDFSGNFGIVGTPVIDKQNNVLYVVSRHVDMSANIDQGPHNNPSGYDVDTAYSSRGFYQLLHAIDIRTGAEKAGSPVVISANANGTGAGNYNGVISFDPRRGNQRGGLVLANGIVYIPYASHCDWSNYHGWLLGYDAGTLQQRMVHLTTPNDGRGGIWMSGAAPAVDNAGNIYFATGNGQVGDGSQGSTNNPNYPADNDYLYTDPAVSPSLTVNRGESVVKLTPNTLDHTATSLSISSFFTPYNYVQYNDLDNDFGTQVMLIPNTNIVMTGCKDNNLYLMDSANLGGFNTGSNAILQTLSVGTNAQMHSSFAYFGGSGTQYAYQLSENTLLKAFPVNAHSLGTAINGNIAGPSGYSGAFMAVSSNGTDPNSAILWINQAVPNCNANQSTCNGLLRAVKANDVTTELWNSSINSGDVVGVFGKMSCPSVANGKVYLATFSNWLAVYGAKKTVCNNNNNVALGKTASASSSQSGHAPSSAFDQDSTTTYWSSNNTDNQYLEVDLGQPYNICKIIITWGADYGSNYDLQSSNDGSTWTTIENVRGNAALKDTTSTTLTARYIRMQGINSGTASGYSIYEMAVYGDASNTCTAPTGLTATPVNENSETLNWQAVAGATGGYIIQYRSASVSSWITRTSTTNTLTLTALTCGADYYFRIRSVCASGQSDSTVSSFTTNACSNPCSLPTRYSHNDIGDIGVAGSSCYDAVAGVFTLKGSGTDIGGNGDAFQFAYTNLAGDEFISAQLLSIDAVSPTNKVGLMMRDSISNTSPFAFIGITSSSGIVFEYRSTSGGPTTTISQAGINYPYWVKLQKAGTVYSAYIAPDGINWTQVGATVNLGFGSTTVYPGLAVTSASNTVLSTATVGSYFESTSPLPINVSSFSAKNINNLYVMLQWTTDSEENSNHFEVQRSTDGIHFETLATVKSAGNSTVPKYYSAEDDNPAQGINFYRFKEVDNDNGFTYSAVVSVNFGRQSSPILFPNPATSYVTVIAGLEAMKEINIYNVEGKLVKTIPNISGASKVTIASGSLAPGVYIVQIRTATQVYEQKLFRQ